MNTEHYFYPATQFQKNACYIILNEAIKSKDIIAVFNSNTFPDSIENLNITKISRTIDKYHFEQYDTRIEAFKSNSEKGNQIIQWCYNTSK